MDAKQLKSARENVSDVDQAIQAAGVIAGDALDTIERLRKWCASAEVRGDTYRRRAILLRHGIVAERERSVNYESAIGAIQAEGIRKWKTRAEQAERWAKAWKAKAKENREWESIQRDAANYWSNEQRETFKLLGQADAERDRLRDQVARMTEALDRAIVVLPELIAAYGYDDDVLDVKKSGQALLKQCAALKEER